MKATYVGLFLCAAFVVGGALAFSRRDPVTGRAIYGTDNRIDEYQVTDNNLLNAGQATVALISKEALTKVGNTFVVSSVTLLRDVDITGSDNETVSVCSDINFGNQPTVAGCSGFLIDNDKIATAGHCIDNQIACDNAYFVFGYIMTDENIPVLVFPIEDVYECKSFKTVYEGDYTGAIDFSVVTTDRPVTGRTPLTIDASPAAEEDSVYVIGHPTGLPRKYADGAAVHYSLPDDPLYQWIFIADLDTFGGNSGSAVFYSETNQVAGILVRGSVDYVVDTERGCIDANVCPVLDIESENCFGEQVMVSKAIAPFVSLSCQDDNQCNNNGVCTNGECLCNSNYHGSDCSFRCSRDVCNNQGDCVGLWECNCDSGFEGTLCVEKADPSGSPPASVALAFVGVIAAAFIAF